jgi:hypothetical protein
MQPVNIENSVIHSPFAEPRRHFRFFGRAIAIVLAAACRHD